VETFAQFGSDLDPATQKQLARGKVLVEVLKQGQYKPFPVERQVVIIYSAINGFCDDYETSTLGRYESELFAFLDSKYASVWEAIQKKKQFDDDVKTELTKALEEFKGLFAE